MKFEHEPPCNDEDEIDSANGQERVRWLLTRYFRQPPIFIRAPYGNFDSLMCDPDGWVWGVTVSVKPDASGAKVVRCKDYLVGHDNTVIEQPLIF